MITADIHLLLFQITNLVKTRILSEVHQDSYQKETSNITCSSLPFYQETRPNWAAILSPYSFVSV